MLRRTWSALPLILALALVVRIAVIVATPHFRPIFDAHDYDRTALSIAHGHGYPDSQFRPGESTAFRPPLYPLVLAAVYAVGGHWSAGRVLNALLGVAVVALVFLIAQRLWGRRTAVVAGVLAAIFPPLVTFAATLLSESLFIALVLAAVLATLEYRRSRHLGWAVAAGVVCGLAALTRANGILLVVGAGAGVWVLRPRLSRAALVAPAVVVVVAALTVAPWVVRNTIVFHRFVGISDQTGEALAGTYNSQARQKGDLPGRGRPPQQLPTFQGLFRDRRLDEAALMSRLTSRGLTYMADHPGRVAETSVWNTLRVFAVVHDGPFRPGWEAGVLQATGDGRLASPLVPVTLYAILILALIGVVAQVRGRARRAPPFIWWFPVLMVLPAIVVWGQPRYRAPVDPFLVMLAAVGLVAILEPLAARYRSVAEPQKVAATT